MPKNAEKPAFFCSLPLRTQPANPARDSSVFFKEIQVPD